MKICKILRNLFKKRQVMKEEAMSVALGGRAARPLKIGKVTFIPGEVDKKDMDYYKEQLVDGLVEDIRNVIRDHWDEFFIIKESSFCVFDGKGISIGAKIEFPTIEM